MENKEVIVEQSEANIVIYNTLKSLKEYYSPELEPDILEKINNLCLYMARYMEKDYPLEDVSDIKLFEKLEIIED